LPNIVPQAARKLRRNQAPGIHLTEQHPPALVRFSTVPKPSDD
jgi:hypothetical protein